jgi:hypothetical protein
MKREPILLVGSQASAGSLEDVIVAAGCELSIVGSQEEGLRIAQEGGVSAFLVEAGAAD